MLLVFTMVLWCIFTLILLADLHNKLNSWCFISGILFSVGALKEYLFYTLGPQLIQGSVFCTQRGILLSCNAVRSGVCLFLS